MSDADRPASPDARVDYDRTRRTGLPEAVYCQAKTVDQCVRIVTEMIARGDDTVIATRCTPDQLAALRDLADPDSGPGAVTGTTVTWRRRPATGRTVALVCGGTSDRPIVDEADAVLSALGHTTRRYLDVGVAGLHRLLDVLPDLRLAEVVIAVAGMEGALPTVLGGQVAAPIIAVPASTGYGTAFEGITAMLGMLASCSPGVSVVGIDNGYGAACAAHRILSAFSTARSLPEGTPT